MIKSMTGYGMSDYEDDRVSYSVEVKTLNSKGADINIRLPRFFASKEMQGRNLIAERMVRGKIMVNVEMEVKDQDLSGIKVNAELFRIYYDQLAGLADDVSANRDDAFRLAAQFQDIFVTEVNEEELEVQWEVLKDLILKACDECDKFRIQEGRVLEQNFMKCIEAIRLELEEVERLDPSRIDRIRERITGNFEQFLQDQSIDQNRLEQELMYYIEKLDISEEKVRLGSHLDYFTKELDTKVSNGKTLGFISQEMGREINTIGSKANDAAIQQHVIRMKEELEKIKEQVLNVL